MKNKQRLSKMRDLKRQIDYWRDLRDDRFTPGPVRASARRRVISLTQEREGLKIKRGSSQTV